MQPQNTGAEQWQRGSDGRGGAEQEALCIEVRQPVQCAE